jgi:hypothetical protein
MEKYRLVKLHKQTGEGVRWKVVFENLETHELKEIGAPIVRQFENGFYVMILSSTLWASAWMPEVLVDAEKNAIPTRPTQEVPEFEKPEEAKAW